MRKRKHSICALATPGAKKQIPAGSTILPILQKNETEQETLDIYRRVCDEIKSSSPTCWFF
jgi:hypothetical protein